ncbi:hypothetical protein U9M48_033187 [Paspalum notatum var. saurae]|uniref:Uncharacterized protein n=1 Tax=Paspalum notatum var. saurae TaxID=547442 RepID=A0AAQ3U6A9_PASNO
MAAYEHQPKGAGEGHVGEPIRPKDNCCLVHAGEAAKAKKQASTTLHRLRLRLGGSPDTSASNGHLRLGGSADTFASNGHLRLGSSADFYGSAHETTLGTFVDLFYSVGQLRLEGFVGQDLDVKGSWEAFGNRCYLYSGYLDYFRGRRLERGLGRLEQRR